MYERSTGDSTSEIYKSERMETMTADGYIHFVEAGKSKSGLTEIWSVKSNAGATLGFVSWYAPWRRYCFQAVPNTVFDATCLSDIVVFLDKVMRDHAS